MASSLAMNPFLLILFLSLMAPRGLGFGCYSSIFNFGDSLSDTGNLNYTCSSPNPLNVCFPPYGDTFFHRPTGRSSDGRLILDFIAQSLGLPLLRPDRSLENISVSVEDFGKGLNFAVGGATALDASGMQPPTAASLRNQLRSFKKIFSSTCASSPSMCRDVLKSSLFLVGEIGGNDYNYPFFERRSLEEIKSFVPLVVKTIASVIIELIELGAETLIVPGDLPIGCSPVYLKLYETPNQDLYDPQNSCLKWLNEFSEYHNQQLQEQLKQIRALYPHVHLIYADYYNAAMRLVNAPSDFGFENPQEVCCVDGNGSYYFPVPCGQPSTIVCDDPSKYISWDGVHLTEAAYRFMAIDLLQGSFTTPQFRISCVPQNASTELLQLV